MNNDGFTIKVNDITKSTSGAASEVEHGQWVFKDTNLSANLISHWYKKLFGALREYFVLEAYAGSASSSFDLSIDSNAMVDANLVNGFDDYQGITLPTNNSYSSFALGVKIPLKDELTGMNLSLYKLNAAGDALVAVTGANFGKNSGYITFDITAGGTYVVGGIVPETVGTSGSSSPTGSLIYNLMFNTNGGNALATARVTAGQTATKPADPFKPGFTFSGWYQDAELKTTFNFATPINKNTWVYAKWTPIEGYVAFTDLGNHTWAATAIMTLFQKGVVTGLSEGKYGPSEYITRGDFMLMLYRAFNLTKGTADTGATFKDVPAGSYYAEAIEVARTLGIAKGSDGYFRPTDRLSRQDAMVLIYRTLQSKGKTPDAGSPLDLAKFTDQALIQSYASEAVAALVKAGMIQGSDGKLNPNGFLTRAEMAVILNKSQ